MKLHEQRNAQAKAIAQAIEEINDFRAYLATPKFTDESAGILRHYINIGEVEYRLMELRHILEDATL